jgi:hypothetical protein
MKIEYNSLFEKMNSFTEISGSDQISREIGTEKNTVSLLDTEPIIRYFLQPIQKTKNGQIIRLHKIVLNSNWFLCLSVRNDHFYIFKEKILNKSTNVNIQGVVNIFPKNYLWVYSDYEIESPKINSSNIVFSFLEINPNTPGAKVIIADRLSIK